jgi:hypothetical protein
VLIYATTWMNLQNMMLSEISQKQKVASYMEHADQVHPLLAIFVGCCTCFRKRGVMVVQLCELQYLTGLFN